MCYISYFVPPIFDDDVLHNLYWYSRFFWYIIIIRQKNLAASKRQKRNNRAQMQIIKVTFHSLTIHLTFLSLVEITSSATIHLLQAEIASLLTNADLYGMLYLAQCWWKVLVHQKLRISILDKWKPSRECQRWWRP